MPKLASHHRLTYPFVPLYYTSHRVWDYYDNYMRCKAKIALKKSLKKCVTYEESRNLIWVKISLFYSFVSLRLNMPFHPIFWSFTNLPFFLRMLSGSFRHRSFIFRLFYLNSLKNAYSSLCFHFASTWPNSLIPFMKYVELFLGLIRQ